MRLRPAGSLSLDPFLEISDVCKDLVRGEKSTRLHPYPTWVNDDERLAAFLRRTFPDSTADKRRQAKNWALIIVLYFRAGWSTAAVAKKLGWKKSTTDRTIQRIRLAMKGLRQDGKPRTGRPKGRPSAPRPEPKSW